MEKLKFNEYLKKYFRERGDKWTSVYEKQELGFAESDLSLYSLSQLKNKYKKYLNNTDKFLKYED